MTNNGEEDRSFHSLALAQHREQGNPPRGTESSSTVSCRLPPLQQGEGTTGDEATLGLALS